MTIDQTVKGGAYQNADGTWVNAKGKRIPPPVPKDVTLTSDPSAQTTVTVVTTEPAETLAEPKPRRTRKKSE